MIVKPSIQADRLTICKSCKFHKVNKKGRITCGTYIFAALIDGQKEIEVEEIKENIVTHYRRKIRLCGCNMNEKTKYTWASCPAGKWGTVGISHDDLVQIKQLLTKYEGQTSFTTNELKPFFTAISKISGKNIQVTTCSPCVKEVIEDLRKATQDIEI